MRRWLAGVLVLLLALAPGGAVAATPTPAPVPGSASAGTLTPAPNNVSAAAGPTSVPGGASAAVPTAVPAPKPQPSPTAAAPTAVPAPPPPTLPPSPTPPPQSQPPATAAAEPAPPREPAAPAAPSAPPTVSPLATASPTPEAEPALPADTFSVWHGLVREGGAFRRAAPSAAAPIEEELDPGTPLRIDRWVPGAMLYPDVITWGEVDPADGGGYVFGGSLQGVLPPAVPPPPDELAGSDGTWIDVNLTLDVVTVYVDGQPAKMMLTSPGRPGFETDTGLFAIRSRFTSQAMAGPGYFVPGVPNVQYFYGGEALHGRYWTLPDVVSGTSADLDEDGTIWDYDPPQLDGGGPNRGVAFGVPSSHGCLGLQVADAAWLFSVGHLGTPVDVHA